MKMTFFEHSVAKGLASFMSGSVLVLGYHDLSDSRDFSSWLKVDVSKFEEQIRLFNEIGHFLRPDELLDPSCHRKDKLNLLMTFDDGFANNYRLGLPLLKEYGVPALFFISTDNMQHGQPFWFDRIIQLIQKSRIYALDLRKAGLGRYSFSKVNNLKRWVGIQALLEDIKSHAGEKCYSLVEKIVSCICDQCQYSEKEAPFDTIRPINQDEIQDMRDSGLCYFGSHSHRHRILTSLDDACLAAELNTSRKILEEVLEGAVTHLSYPNGNVDARVRKASLEAGYRLGYSVKAGKVNGLTDPMNIPRMLISGFDKTDLLLWKMGRNLLKKPSPILCKSI